MLVFTVLIEEMSIRRIAPWVSVKFAPLAQVKTFASLTNEVLRLCRKVKLSVPHIVPKAHFMREARFTSEGHFTFRVSGTLS